MLQTPDLAALRSVYHFVGLQTPPAADITFSLNIEHAKNLSRSLRPQPIKVAGVLF
jgi:hypothetical protein